MISWENAIEPLYRSNEVFESSKKDDILAVADAINNK